MSIDGQKNPYRGYIQGLLWTLLALAIAGSLVTFALVWGLYEVFRVLMWGLTGGTVG